MSKEVQDNLAKIFTRYTEHPENETVMQITFMTAVQVIAVDINRIADALEKLASFDSGVKVAKLVFDDTVNDADDIERRAMQLYRKSFQRPDKLGTTYTPWASIPHTAKETWRQEARYDKEIEDSSNG